MQIELEADGYSFSNMQTNAVYDHLDIRDHTLSTGQRLFKGSTYLTTLQDHVSGSFQVVPLTFAQYLDAWMSGT